MLIYWTDIIFHLPIALFLSSFSPNTVVLLIPRVTTSSKGGLCSHLLRFGNTQATLALETWIHPGDKSQALNDSVEGKGLVQSLQVVGFVVNALDSRCKRLRPLPSCSGTLELHLTCMDLGIFVKGG